jgi:S1-C subfamily serine protease
MLEFYKSSKIGLTLKGKSAYNHIGSFLSYRQGYSMTLISRKIIIFLLVLSLASLACGALSSPSAPALVTPNSPTIEPDVVSPDPIDLSNQQDRLVRLYEQSNPGVVAIRVLSDQGDGLGSGFVIDKEGYIVTNYHVVRDAQDLEIAFPNGYKTRGEILGTDSDSDIAVIVVDAPSEELHPLPLGDSNQLKVGQIVVAIGNPLGYDGTMTTGIISSLGRTLDSLHEAPGGSYFTAGDIIQTDAAINPGNSGGPLLNLDGEVVGINFAIQSTSFDLSGNPVNSGIGFAVSINIVKRVVPTLISSGSYDYPYLGISSLPEITLYHQDLLGLPQTSGVYLLEVTDGGPADLAGLRAGDVHTGTGYYAGGDLITAINGLPVRDFSDLITYLLNNTNPGDTVTLTVLRDGTEIQVDLILGKRP